MHPCGLFRTLSDILWVLVEACKCVSTSCICKRFTWKGYIASLLGCVVLIEFCKRLKAVRFLTFVGLYSLCFYFLSGALPMVVSMLTNHFLPTDNIWTLMIVFAICLFISTSVTYVLNRYLPFVFDFRKIKNNK